jgi:hypothetical protein
MYTIVGRIREEKKLLEVLDVKGGIMYKAYIKEIICESVGCVRLVGVQWLTLMCEL